MYIAVIDNFAQIIYVPNLRLHVMENVMYIKKTQQNKPSYNFTEEMINYFKSSQIQLHATSSHC